MLADTPTTRSETLPPLGGRYSELEVWSSASVCESAYSGMVTMEPTCRFACCWSEKPTSTSSGLSGTCPLIRRNTLPGPLGGITSSPMSWFGMNVVPAVTLPLSKVLISNTWWTPRSFVMLAGGGLGENTPASPP